MVASKEWRARRQTCRHLKEWGKKQELASRSRHRRRRGNTAALLRPGWRRPSPSHRAGQSCSRAGSLFPPLASAPGSQGPSMSHTFAATHPVTRSLSNHLYSVYRENGRCYSNIPYRNIHNTKAFRVHSLSNSSEFFPLVRNLEKCSECRLKIYSIYLNYT